MKSIYKNGGKLTGKQNELDKNNDGQISGEDLKLARDDKKAKKQSKRALRKAFRKEKSRRSKRDFAREMSGSQMGAEQSLAKGTLMQDLANYPYGGMKQAPEKDKRK